MYQNYQDSIAVCRKYGCPDLFVTFTSNAGWPEILETLSSIPGQQPSDRPDIVNRVFKMKLNMLMDDIKKKKILQTHKCRYVLHDFYHKLIGVA